jgi:protein-tyrosine-phosphatase
MEKRHFVVLNKLIIKAQLIGKPVSCHLYPVRIKDFTEFAAVNYDKWDICDPACSLGQELEAVYKFVKEALVRRFGEDWY